MLGIVNEVRMREQEARIQQTRMDTYGYASESYTGGGCRAMVRGERGFVAPPQVPIHAYE